MKEEEKEEDHVGEGRRESKSSPSFSLFLSFFRFSPSSNRRRKKERRKEKKKKKKERAEKKLLRRRRERRRMSVQYL
ncbi:hypothetical protein CSUI_008710 [Cystoisospora suis]|uniref:Uncharacterized protein n=1 Tax=Cystoisospora suis TaxID=483139 RepID=A0A2C6KLU5_9APIC|nr:hypothetical protein CSUI_008710 [Cystoisospora suis]